MSFTIPNLARRLISDLQPQEHTDQTFRVADKQLRANRQGGKYILIKLVDRSGTLTGMMWNAEDSVFESFDRSDFVRCKGRLQLYNGGLQLIVTEICRVAADEVDLADFERFDATRADELVEQLNGLVNGVKNDHLRAIGRAFLDDESFVRRFKQSPAAINNHHAYPGGLIQHTVDLMELARLITPRYRQLDGDLVMFGAFLHDLGKIEELSGGDETTYTDRGQLVGHIVIGVQMLAERIAQVEDARAEPFPPTLRWKLEHLILSHHGLLEYGSPKVPLMLEAIALHHLDNLDAKIAAATSIIETDVSADGNWTNYNPAMGRKLWKESPTQTT